MNINNWLNSIADAGKELLRRRIKNSAGTDLDSISRICEALYSNKGIKQSAGLLVNYQYDLEKVEENHERLFNSGEVTASKSVLTLLKQK